MTGKDSVKEICSIYIYQNQLELAAPGRAEQSRTATDIPAMAFRNCHNEALTDPHFQDDIQQQGVPLRNLCLLRTLIT